MTKKSLADYIRSIPDWPKPGILFKDITPLLANSEAMSSAIDAIADKFKAGGVDCVAGVEARGFIFGAVLAQKLGVGFVPIRKAGKLPYKTLSVTYDLEYGSDTVEIHVDAFEKGAKVLMIDDLLATGGTMAAACELVKKAGGEIAGIEFLIELKFLNGRDKLNSYGNVSAIIEY
ncbi:MAG: adenine phosphoribosyltransferase [Anaerohalosphaeraceae bacterium]|nr:adenine phosphoribosyltransferase [Anaerohalosphaeraceae bacterium]